VKKAPSHPYACGELDLGFEPSTPTDNHNQQATKMRPAEKPSLCGKPCCQAPTKGVRKPDRNCVERVPHRLAANLIVDGGGSGGRKKEPSQTGLAVEAWRGDWERRNHRRGWASGKREGSPTGRRKPAAALDGPNRQPAARPQAGMEAMCARYARGGGGRGRERFLPVGRQSPPPVNADPPPRPTPDPQLRA
jgi:hypothetical protein